MALAYFPEEKRDQSSSGNFGGYTWEYWTEPYKYTVNLKSSQKKEESLPPALQGLGGKRQERLNEYVFRWGKMPVEYAMDELGFNSLDFDDKDQLVELNNYLIDNFPDIYQQFGEEEEKEEEREPYEIIPYEPKELTLEGYTPTPTKSLRTSQLKIGDAPKAAPQMTIKGTSGWSK